MDRIDWGHDALDAENLADEWRSLAIQERAKRCVSCRHGALWHLTPQAMAPAQWCHRHGMQVPRGAGCDDWTADRGQA